jgi:PPOX class probable F420-dependent enzyme
VEEKIIKLIRNIPVGYLATAASNLQPYATPVVFVVKNDYVYVPLDQKPKSVTISNLKRIKNIQENPKVCFLVHHYDQDWTKLWFVMMTGCATLVDDKSKTSGVNFKAIHKQLLGKYLQYKIIDTSNFYIGIRIDKSTCWRYSGAK